MDQDNQEKGLESAFKLFDSDNDGKISKGEMKQFLLNLNYKIDDEDVAQILEKINCEDHIDYETFKSVLLHKRLNKSSIDSELVEAFKLFDNDHSGYISAEELRYILKKFCDTLNSDEVDEFIRYFDQNGDGEINFDEFLMLFRQ